MSESVLEQGSMGVIQLSDMHLAVLIEAHRLGGRRRDRRVPYGLLSLGTPVRHDA